MEGVGKMYLAFEVAEEEAAEDLARFVAVADVLEGFGSVLAAYIEEDFFAASIVKHAYVSRVLVLVCVIDMCSLQRFGGEVVGRTYGCSSTKLVAL